jgi:hypothetical protein
MTNSKARPARKLPDAETLLNDPGYRQVLELDFSDMIPFVLTNIRKRGIIPLIYMAANILLLVIIILYAIWGVRMELLNAGKIFWQLLAGFLAGSILVIAPHELLHGLAYRIIGARKISFGADLQQFIFYVTASRFPISKYQLVFLAMTPFILINVIVTALTLAWASQFTLFSASLLLCHNIMCIGDFAVVNYACKHRGPLYTFDDTENKKSYFFERRGQ